MICLGVGQLSAQIRGVVTDAETGDPIPYLNIYYEGKGVGAVTNLDGEYSISYHEGWNELTFSMVGYSTQVLKVSSKTRTLNVKMIFPLMLSSYCRAKGNLLSMHRAICGKSEVNRSTPLTGKTKETL